MRKRFVSSIAIASVIFFAVSAGSSFAAEATKTPPPSSKAASQTNKANKADQKPVTTGSTSKPTKQPEAESAVGNMLQISAAVPPEFDKTILVNFTSTDNENVMARLDKLNGYTYEEDVKPGTYKVDFINVVGENATDYNIDSSEKVIVKKGDTVEFKIQLSLKPTAKPKEELSSNEEPTEASVERMLNGTDSSGNQNAVTDRGVQSSANSALSESAAVKPTEKPQRQKFTIQPQTLKIIIGITIIALLALMVFLYKQISYKHDYYDC
ncbi:hypothetical protein QP794_31920 [Paenibacillus sp. UMB7766-LJ446]|uniref:Uncharacterized protein n=1 Tax=Paenibacillus urinalis TaxID=521520 RepID=A0AAX3N6Q4_9BACL|nr:MULTISPECIES: hypothetical protein [Paenibacillaceae]MDK8194700.1 hypothetical protein [Paenibacillus sp. UMB7766-LJ446]WDH85491.1 hypothetical protein PUW23_26355 [Paenibacillus urinalis]GAK43407.1 hypothetical protein TCA2_5904 [Paenibacillus sp. TCA20]SDX85862.1 hypothetical protein SAMN05518848_12032 [Paenibacillus sp. PDC88]